MTVERLILFLNLERSEKKKIFANLAVTSGILNCEGKINEKRIIMTDITHIFNFFFFSENMFWFLRVGTSFDLKSTYS